MAGLRVGMPSCEPDETSVGSLEGVTFHFHIPGIDPCILTELGALVAEADEFALNSACDTSFWSALILSCVWVDSPNTMFLGMAGPRVGMPSPESDEI